MRLPRLVSTALALFAVAVLVTPRAAQAATYTIDWLTQSPPAVGSAIPNGSVYNVAGIGPVTVTHSIGASVSDSRSQNPLYTAGSVLYSGDTYQWSNFEYFGTILTTGPDPLVPVVSTVTYTFPYALAPGSVYVGTIGLGATTSFGGGASTMTVNQNGTFLGDFNGYAGFGASQFTGGVGTFTVQNSVTGAGGQDPHWNSQLAVVRIEDTVSSLTIIHSGLRGDGIGANVGFVRDFATGASGDSWGRIKSLYRAERK